MQQIFSKDNYKMKLPAPRPTDSYSDSIFETGSPSNQKQKAESQSRARIISQSTLGDNSSKVPVKTASNEVAHGSRTTDDLLELSLETAEVVLREYPINQRSTYLAGRNNSTTLEHRSLYVQDMSELTSNSVRKQNLKGLLGDYSSQTLLPQVRDSLSIAAKSQFKKNDPYQQSHNRSRVELSKKEIQQFQLNGVVSREFIHQNKRELEAFIKTQSKQRLEGNPLDQSGNQILGLQYSTMADGSHIKKEVVLSEEQKLLAGLDPAGFVFSEDVRPDRGFSGETSQITSKVVENWINQTLADAEHLDIPSVILKPENKVPITRYGIDRISLTQSGLSSDQVDRIYRGLFVYSVGFYENLKKQIQNCSSNQMLGLQTNLWKTFNVLLEYCCKTDYRLLISKITQQNDEDKVQIVEKYKTLMQLEINEKKMLKQNMLVMQSYQETLEKDRNNERGLRLKLEEEYMQIQRNHEEEVTLRLKFEGKLNALNTAHRELEIKYERVQQQLDQSLLQQQRLDLQCKVQSEELVALRTRETDQLSQLEILRDFKTSALVEIEKKNKLIFTAEEARKAAIDEADIIKYQVQDSDNQTRRLEMRLQDLTVGRISLENHIKTLESQIKDQLDKTATKQEQLEKQRQTYEVLALDHTHVTEDFQIVKVTSDAHIKIINQLREQLEQSYLLYEDHQMHSIVYKAERDELRRELSVMKQDLQTTSEQLREMNKERHQFEDLYNEACKRIESLEKIIDQQRNKLEGHAETIQRQLDTIAVFKDTLARMEEQAQKALKDRIANDIKQNLKITQFSDIVNQTTQERNSWMREAETRQEIIKNKEQQLNQKEERIQSLLLTQQDLEKQILDVEEQSKRYALQAKQALDRIQSEHKMLSDAVRKQLALEETVRYLTQQKDELQDRYSAEFQLLREKFNTQLENAQMSTEEAFSVMEPYAKKLLMLDEALLTAQEAKVIKANAIVQAELYQKTCDSLQQADKTVEELENQLYEQDTDFDSIVERIIQIEHDRLEEIQRENEGKLAQLHEQILKSKGRESEQNKKLLRAEKRLELFQKTGSVGKKSGEKSQDNFKDSARSKEASRERTSNQSSNAIQKSATSKVSQVKSNGRFDQMIKDSQEKKQKQEKVNALIMGRQIHNKSHEPSDISELNRTVIPKKNFKPKINPDEGKKVEQQLSHTQDQASSAFKEIQQKSASDVQLDQSFEQDQLDDSQEEVMAFEEQESEEDEVGELDVEQLIQDNIVEEEIDPPQRDMQAEKYEEYKAYVLDTSNNFLELFKDYSLKLKKGLIREGSQQQKEELKKIMSLNEKLPETFLNLRLTDDQKISLAEEQETQKFNFQVNNEDIFPLEDEESDSQEEEQEVTRFGSDIRKQMFAGKPVAIELKDKKQKSNGIGNLFSQFAQRHVNLLEKLVQEHAARVEKAALERRKVKLVDTKIDGQVKGKQKSHYLIKMRKDPNYYEVHRNSYLDGIKKAEEDLANREEKLKAADEDQKRKADEIAKILLDRHKRKVAKIEIVREYLQQPEAQPQIDQVKADPDIIQAEPTPLQDFKLEPDISQTKRLLAQYPIENATEPIKESKRLSPVKQILDAVISMSNSTQPVDPELQQYIKGGVAGLNRQFNKSSSKRIITGPARIRTLIKSVNSRL